MLSQKSLKRGYFTENCFGSLIFLKDSKVWTVTVNEYKTSINQIKINSIYFVT